ncbi:MAG TPA: ABC transporter ATP-binding protein [Lacunisphaera sp.]|nr:ABC transporter ATP-binding protein [Lacunisphaera sp.]
MNAIETRGLTRTYGRADAVHGLTLDVPAGSVFAFIGPNGAGKTTTIRMLMNLLEPTSGEARVLGTDSRKLTPRERRRIGYVSENQKLPEWMTVEQLLRYCEPLYPTWDRQLEQDLVRKFELPRDRKLKHLSRGMMMKAALLSSLAYRPELLVLDEPFSGLDPLVRDEFIAGALEVSRQEKWTIFISSHDINEVEQLASWVGLVEGGRLTLAEPTEDLLGRFRRIEITVNGDGFNIPAAPETWLEVQREGSLVRAIETRFDAGKFESYRRHRLGDAAVAVKPMTLRQIFIALAKEGRAQGRDAVA